MLRGLIAIDRKSVFATLGLQAMTAMSGPVDPEACNSRGKWLAEQGQLDAAIEQFEAAYRLWEQVDRSKSLIALRNWCGALIKQGQYERAATKAGEMLERKPDDIRSYDIYNRLANALVKAGRLKDAAWCWRQAVIIGEKAQSQNRAIVLRAWGEALAEQKDYELAAARLREALEIDPDHARSHETRNYLATVLRTWGEALTERQDFARAAICVRQALETQPDDELSYNACNFLASALVKAGRFEDAAELWREAVAIGEDAQSKNRAIALRSWATALIKRKEYNTKRLMS